jgi:hypothetical protein
LSQFGASAIAQPIFNPVIKSETKPYTSRSPIFARLFKRFKERLGGLLQEGGYVATYARNLDTDIEEGTEIDHWRRSSHAKNKVIVLGMMQQVYGDAVRDWAVAWFQDNEPKWLSL